MALTNLRAMRHRGFVVVFLQLRIVSVSGASSIEWAADPPKRKHPCRFCGKLFTRRGHASQHERQHTGDLPYSCVICNKKFVNKSHYDYHITRSLEHQTKLRNCDM